MCVIKRILNFTSIILSLALQYIRLIKQISSIADLFSFELNALIVIGLYLLDELNVVNKYTLEVKKKT